MSETSELSDRRGEAPRRVSPTYRHNRGKAAASSSGVDSMVNPRKRKDSDSEADLTSDFPNTVSPKVLRSMTGRGTYHNTASSQARRERREAAILDTDSEATATEIEKDQTRSPRRVQGRRSPDTSMADLVTKTKMSSDRILMLVSSSKNLKGTIKKEIKEESMAIYQLVKSIAERSTSEELKRVQADNKRLKGQLSALEREVVALRQAFAERGNQREKPSSEVEGTVEETQASSPGEGVTRMELAIVMERFQRELSEQFGRILGARLEGLEVDGRLLPGVSHRPALASDTGKRNHKPVDAPTTLIPPANMPKEARAKKGAKTKAVETTSRRAAEQIAGPSYQETQVVLEGWTTVVKKAKPKKSPPAPSTAKASRKKLSLPKQPKSLAVVVALKPEAVAEGITYKDAIAKAKQSVSLQELGISSTKFRTGMTGARIIELPKEVTAAQADSLASKIGQALGDAAKVTRPKKMVNVRISGLDDSVTPEEICLALADNTGVSPNDFKVGLITHGYTGVGSTITACPIETIAKLAEVGRLCVGWSAATIRVLEQRPMRCHRCYDIGHPQQLCPSNKDRSGLCFRCGEEGHISKDCTAALCCAVCKDRGLASGHRMGGVHCNPPPVKGRPLPWRTAPSSSATSAAPVETPMETNNAS
ncbi:unnamed protein product [Danaus chrysippus]|uniref:(African queen) hypothetical protein n=1 Tax=Danaus chrysippus TaxID=151541 RepID=A0A8J2QSR1_9NEOP|nr:unnamed protein product [Danaus chrysippus]